MLNLHTHFQGDTIDELTSLVEVTERAAFTTKFAGCRESAESELNKAAHKSSQVNVTNTPSLITEQPAINSARVSPDDGTAQGMQRDSRIGRSTIALAAAHKSVEYSQKFTPRVLSPLELAQAEEAFHFDLRSDFDEMYGREEFEEEAE